MVAAYAHRSGIVAGQQAVAHKRNELEAVYRLLDRAGLAGPGGDGRRSVHATESMPGDRGQGGHYLLSVKDNQPTLKQDIADLWAEDLPPQAEQVGQHGDRVELRRIWGVR